MILILNIKLIWFYAFNAKRDVINVICKILPCAMNAILATFLMTMTIVSLAHKNVVFVLNRNRISYVSLAYLNTSYLMMGHVVSHVNFLAWNARKDNHRSVYLVIKDILSMIKLVYLTLRLVVYIRMILAVSALRIMLHEILNASHATILSQIVRHALKIISIFVLLVNQDTI